MINEPPDKLDDGMALRVANDLLKRGIMGPYIYPIFWPVVAIAADFDESHPKIFLLVTLLMVFFSILRLIHASLLNRCFPERFVLWNRLLLVSAFPHALLWSLMFALSLRIDNSIFAVFMSFSSAGLIAGGTISFSPSRFMSFGFLLVFILPPLIIAAFIPEQRLISVMLLAFLFFTGSLSRNQQREYWYSLNNELILAKQSRTDALTQLDNRRYFDERLKEFCHLSSRNRDQLTVLVIDCDHFKNINDTHGHNIGDECLKHLAAIFGKALTRTTDVCARYGGEEFSMILPGVEQAGAKIVSERIRLMVESTPLVIGKETICMTVSIGCVSRKLEHFFPGLPQELFKQADASLYLAKKAGRNCCVYSYYDAVTEQYIVDCDRQV